MGEVSLYENNEIEQLRRASNCSSLTYTSVLPNTLGFSVGELPNTVTIANGSLVPLKTPATFFKFCACSSSRTRLHVIVTFLLYSYSGVKVLLLLLLLLLLLFAVVIKRTVLFRADDLPNGRRFLVVLVPHLLYLKQYNST